MNADSVKARLKNFAVSTGCTFQEALVYYGLERTIYRISVSPYVGHFVLKPLLIQAGAPVTEWDPDVGCWK